MKVYLDTSVILRRLLNEIGQVAGWAQWTEAYSSRLWKTEAARTIHRLRMEGLVNDKDVACLQADMTLIDESLHVVPVSERILTRAGEPFPTIVGTLDGIHLASAMLIHSTQPLDVFLTHDRQQATAARSLGFTVDGT